MKSTVSILPRSADIILRDGQTVNIEFFLGQDYEVAINIFENDALVYNANGLVNPHDTYRRSNDSGFDIRLKVQVVYKPRSSSHLGWAECDIVNQPQTTPGRFQFFAYLTIPGGHGNWKCGTVNVAFR